MWSQAVQRRRDALRILERSAKGEGFSQLFADTAALAKDRESSFDDQLLIFYGLLTDLLELTSHAKQPQLRNPHLAKELEALSKGIDVDWVMRAIAGFDELHLGLAPQPESATRSRRVGRLFGAKFTTRSGFPSMIIDCSKRLIGPCATFFHAL